MGDAHVRQRVDAVRSFNRFYTKQIGELHEGLRGSPYSLIEAMRAIQTLFGGRAEPRAPYLLRSHRPGDMGWIIRHHGSLYAEEYGWDETFEALVAEIAAKFIRSFDPKRERCWIAERERERRLPPHPFGAAPELRPRPGRRDGGVDAGAPAPRTAPSAGPRRLG
jgi:hypothetical protein